MVNSWLMNIVDDASALAALKGLFREALAVRAARILIADRGDICLVALTGCALEEHLRETVCSVAQGKRLRAAVRHITDRMTSFGIGVIENCLTDLATEWNLSGVRFLHERDVPGNPMILNLQYQRNNG